MEGRNLVLDVVERDGHAIEATKPATIGGRKFTRRALPACRISCYKSRTVRRRGPGRAAGFSRKDRVVGHQDGCLADGGSLDRRDRGAPSTDRGRPGEGFPDLRADLLRPGGDGDHQGAGRRAPLLPGGPGHRGGRRRRQARGIGGRALRAARPTRTRRASPPSTSRSSRASTRCGCTCARSGACSCSPPSARSRSPSGSSAATSRPSRRWSRPTCASSSRSPRATWAAGSRSWT